MHNKVDSLRSQSENLKDTLQSKESQIVSLSDEKTNLLATVESLEEKLRKSTQTVTELQQKCDLMGEQLESLKVEKGVLEQEKDISVLQKTQEKINLESSAKKVKELQEKLDKEVKNKKELLQVVHEMEGMLEEQKKYAEQKNKELAEMEKMLKLAVGDNEACVKDKEAREEELTFAYEDLRGRLEREEKALKEKCNELAQAKKELKQTLEKIEGMKEVYEGELDRVKFELRDSNSDCALLRGENEQLKNTAAGGTDQSAWNKEKKKLLHQLEESKIRFNQAKSSQEKLEKELNQANLKVISLESKGNSTEAEEIKRLQTRVSELNQEVQKWKAIANNKEKATLESKVKVDEIKRLQTRVSELNQELQKWKAIANNKGKTSVDVSRDAEIKRLQARVCELQEELEKAKALADEKRKTADKTLATNLKLASKIEKLSRGKESPHSKEQNVVRSPTESASVKESVQDSTWQCPPRPTRVNLTQAVSNAGVFSPLAKSLANLEIKSLNTATTVTADNRLAASSTATQVTSTRAVNTHAAAATANSRRPVHAKRDNADSNVPQIEREKGVGMATRRGIPKPSEAVLDSKKRAGEQGMQSVFS